jgi:undecaprenyl-diphosphatase
VVELALIAGLVRAGGDEAQVVAAVLLFRLLTYLLPIAIGAGTYIYWRRNRSWRDSAPPLSAAMASAEGGTADAATTSPRRPQLVQRRRVDVIYLGAGLALFALASFLAHSGLVAGEAAVFNGVNGLPDALKPVIWPFMQYGVFLTIPVLTVVALILRRVRLAIAMAIAGVGVYLLARVVKGVVDRGRPGELIDGVVSRETFAVGSLGYPSGHAAVAAALTVVVTPYLRGWWRYVPVTLLLIVCVGRMYVAAHVPLDLIGGAALGLAAGAIANLLVKVPETAARSVAAQAVAQPS